MLHDKIALGGMSCSYGVLKSFKECFIAGFIIKSNHNWWLTYKMNFLIEINEYAWFLGCYMVSHYDILLEKSIIFAILLLTQKSTLDFYSRPIIFKFKYDKIMTFH